MTDREREAKRRLLMELNMLQTDLDARLSAYDMLPGLLSKFRRTGSLLRGVVDLLFPAGTVVDIDHPRFYGIGIVVESDKSPGHLVLELENGNRWSCDTDLVTILSEEDWPEWVRRRKAASSTKGAAAVPLLSTGAPSTLGTYRRIAALLTGKDSPATKMLDERIASEGADAVVLQEESQMLQLISQFGLGSQDDRNRKH